MDEPLEPRDLLNETFIKRESIIGVISGKRVALRFQELFPSLTQILDYRPEGQRLSAILDGVIDPGTFENLASKLRFGMQQSQQLQILRVADVKRWFRNDLSTEVIDAKVSANDLQSIGNALAAEKEFMAVVDASYLKSVVPICKLSARLARKALLSVDKQIV